MNPTVDEPMLYTQAGCAESAKVRAWLVDHGIAFTERNVTTDSDAARDLFATGIFATPLLVVGEEKVLGFHPRALAAILRHQHRAGAAAIPAGQP